MNAVIDAVAPPVAAEEHHGGWDWTLLGAALALASFGLVMITSASSHVALGMFDNTWHFVIRQAAGLILGGVLAAVAISIPWRWYPRLGAPAWLLSVLTLALVQTPLGHAAKGAPRWIKLGPINVQPSEFAKLALILALASYLARNEGRLKDVLPVGLPGLMLLLPMAFLIHLQSDLGTIALLFGITGVAFFVAGLEWRWMFGALAAAGVAVAGLVISEPYRLKRALSFLNPHDDPLGAGYQVVQAWVAFAVGGIAGQGLGEGVAQQGFVPEAHNDMILAVVAEEFGIIGWCFVMFLYGVILWRGITHALQARDLYTMLVAAGIVSLFTAQVLINAGVIGGLVPPKGLVLPLMSYGASAAVGHTLCIAILLKIGMENDRAASVRRAAGGG